MIGQEELKRQLSYDQATGAFIWKIVNSNCVRVGDIAGTIVGGYRRIMVNGRLHYAHRLAWLYVHGEWPVKELDHINRIKTDNRISNLRKATASENARNRARPKNNTSGVKGVYWHAPDRKWCARLTIEGTRIHLGYFTDLEAAAAAYAAAVQKYHGEFAWQAA